MKIDMEPTGERVLEDAYVRSLGTYTIYAMHAASYAFVQAICAGKTVLDFGCGSGYGAKRISGLAKTVYGVDVANDAVAYARAHYRSENLKFLEISPHASLPFPDGSFDVVLSFQVIEHVSDDDAYLREVHRLLKSGGTFVVITPDRENRLFPGQRPWNRWHLREYAMEQLACKVRKYFNLTKKLRMGARREIAAVELKRYAIARWATLPVTLPFVPDRVRRRTLDMAHAMMGWLKRIKPNRRDGVRKRFGFDENDFIIGDDPPNSMNLILVAVRSDDDRQRE